MKFVTVGIATRTNKVKRATKNHGYCGTRRTCNQKWKQTSLATGACNERGTIIISEDGELEERRRRASCALWTAASAQDGPSTARRAQVYRQDRPPTRRATRRPASGCVRTSFRRCDVHTDAYCVTHTLTHAENLTVSLLPMIPTATPTYSR